MKTYTISALAQRCSLSRSTLLYYNKIGLLQPAGRSGSDYRLYGTDELERLRKICALRQTGLSLKDIKATLDGERPAAARALQKRLHQIGDEIKRLKIQRDVTLKIIRHPDLQADQSERLMTKEMWTEILQDTGLDENGMRRWHYEFETTAAAAHQQFLEALGVPEKEIRLIRAWSRAGEATR